MGRKSKKYELYQAFREGKQGNGGSFVGIEVTLTY
jgi:hypothetical protein